MSLWLRLLLMPVFAFAMLVLAVWLDTSGTWPLGFWLGRSQADAQMHSVFALVTFAVFWLIGTSGGRKAGQELDLDAGTIYGLTACGGCARRRAMIRTYIAPPERKTNWWAAAGCFSLLGIILLIAHAIHS